MNRLTNTALILMAALNVIGCGGGSNGAAQPGGGEAEEAISFASTPSNAADEYWRIDESIDEDVANRLKDVETLDALSPAVIAELRSIGHQLDSLVIASQMAHCDFEIAWEEGYDLPLYHLAPNRRLVQCLQADALRLAADRQQDRAVERIETMLRMAQQVARDDMLIIKLVAFADVAAVCEAIRELHARNLLDTSHQRELAQALTDIDTPNPFNAREGMTNDLKQAATTLRTNQFEPEFEHAFILELPQAQRNTAANTIERLIPQFRDAWDARNPLMAIQRVFDDQTDPLVKVFTAGLDSYRRQVDRTLRELREVIELLEGGS